VGISARTAQDISTAIAGTVSVVEASRPASVWVSAYAHSVNAIAVGNTPR
jgi:hypothetical protein